MFLHIYRQFYFNIQCNGNSGRWILKNLFPRKNSGERTSIKYYKSVEFVKTYAQEISNSFFPFFVSNTHMRSHTKEGFKTCPTFGQLCPNNSALSRHLVTHSGKSSFMCHICNYAFAVPSELKIIGYDHIGHK